MNDVFSFLASDERFNPDNMDIDRNTLEERLKEYSFNDILESILELNKFLLDLAKVFKEERDVNRN